MYLELSFIPSYFELPSAPYMLPFWRVFVPASMSADKIFVDFWTQQIEQVKISVLDIAHIGIGQICILQLGRNLFNTK